MLAVLSPAKSLDLDPAPPTVPDSQPQFAPHTAALAERARALSPADLKRLMGISDTLAELNHARFQVFEPTAYRRDDNAKPAVLAFSGDTYIGLDAPTLAAEDLTWAQDRLRILSGLYGALRPLDLMQPYRLEMGTKLDTARGKDLYAFWKGLIGPALDDAVADHAHPIIINLASTEYFKAAEAKRLKHTVITPVFKDEKPGGHARVVSFMAKRARGMMARHIVVNRLEDPEDLKDFSSGGYTFRPEQSDATTWIFQRLQP
ncbi:MAG: peroxide stress protein YaaA [Rhodospirillaceae bacterium]